MQSQRFRASRMLLIYPPSTPKAIAGPLSVAGLHPRPDGLLANPLTRSLPSGGEFGRLVAIYQRSAFRHVEESGEFFELIHERAPMSYCGEL